MKNMKRLLCVLLSALLMVSAASVTAFAADADCATGSNDISIEMSSNFFYDGTYEFESVDRVTLSYDLKSGMGLINAQWVLTYDPAKLSVVSAKMPKIANPVIVQKSGMIVGSFTNLALVEFPRYDTFAFVTFDVIGSGSTNVDMQLDYLGVGNPVGGDVAEAYVVNGGIEQNITSQQGFENYTYDMDAWAYSGGVDFKLYDVDGNGQITINDATELQRFLAEMTTLTAKQMLSADVNGDGKVNVLDITDIQRYLAA